MGKRNYRVWDMGVWTQKDKNPVEVTLKIDMGQLVRSMMSSARKSSRGRAQRVYGAIVMEIKPERKR
jgi:hypothetical protein